MGDGGGCASSGVRLNVICINEFWLYQSIYKRGVNDCVFTSGLCVFIYNTTVPTKWMR